MPELTYLEAIRLAMYEEMQRDPRVFVIGEDVGTYGGAFRVTQGFLETFGPSRVIDTPISESAIVGAAIGAALMGMRPVAEMQFIDFISCAFDMLVNYAAKSRYRWGGGVPLVVRGPCGGGVHGGPFHSQNPEAFFMNVPGLKIVAPGTPRDAKGLMTAAIRDPDPVIFLEHKFLYRRLREDVPEGDFRRAHREGPGRPRRHGRERADLRGHAAGGPGGRRGRGQGRHLGRGGRPAHPPAPRRGGHPRLGRQDGQGRGAPRGHAYRRAGGRDRRPRGRARLRVLDAPVLRLAPPDTPVPYSPPLEEDFLPNALSVGKAIRALYDY